MKKYILHLLILTCFFAVFFLIGMDAYADTPTYITTNVTLSTNTTYGDLYLQSGTLDMNGYTVTVTGKLIQSGGTLYVHGGSMVLSTCW